MTDAELLAILKRVVIEVRPEAAGSFDSAARLQTDLGLTSVEVIDVVLGIEDGLVLEVPEEATGELIDATVGDLVARIRELQQRARP